MLSSFVGALDTGATVDGDFPTGLGLAAGIVGAPGGRASAIGAGGGGALTGAGSVIGAQLEVGAGVAREERR